MNIAELMLQQCAKLDGSAERLSDVLGPLLALSRAGREHGAGAEAVLFESGRQVVVLGAPPAEDEHHEEQQHNCDDMGCGQRHVVARYVIPG